MVLFSLSPVDDHVDNGSDQRVRALGVKEALKLPAGSGHYRAYVGPPDRYDFLSSSQFALLFALGLRETHRVLDFGCGSLRLGRLLIPFLLPQHYCGIDPNRWLISDAIERELGKDAIRIKQPSFAFNDDFRCDIFGMKFDYIVAQSILTHCGYDLAERLLVEAAGAVAENGKIIFSIIEASVAGEQPARRGWTYPECVQYGVSAISTLCAQAGLTCIRLPWYHPGATWYIAARSSKYLPSTDEVKLLHGAVLFDPQFKTSVSR